MLPPLWGPEQWKTLGGLQVRGEGRSTPTQVSLPESIHLIGRIVQVCLCLSPKNLKKDQGSSVFKFIPPHYCVLASAWLCVYL